MDDIRKRVSLSNHPGLRSLIATKAERLFVDSHSGRGHSPARNPTVATLPPEAESSELLARTRQATLGAADTMLTIW
jgi:hypothetical protein